MPKPASGAKEPVSPGGSATGWPTGRCSVPVRDQLGLARVRRAYTGGAALGPDVFRFYHAIGVNLKQLYGQTEVSGISVVHRDGDIRFQTVGVPLPRTEIRISDEGEILCRSPAVFQGYFRNPAATAETLEDGWLHSGDAGYFDDGGHLVVIDRLADVMKLADGSNFSPQFVENKLKFSPYVGEAVVFGGSGAPFVTAMIAIDMENAGQWAERRRIPYTTFTDLARRAEVYRLVREHVDEVNGELPPAARIHRFLLLYKELHADDAELTRTRKVRRRHIAGRFREIIDALQGAGDSVTVATEITYQDGRTAAVEHRLRIETMDGTSVKPTTMDIFLQLTVSGLSTGMIYALAAAGFVVIYKASDVINFAQGDLLLLGTYLIFFGVAQVGLPWSLGVAVTLLLAVIVALAVERLVLRPLVGEPIISMIMVTIGLSSVLRGVTGAIWGPNPRSFDSFLPAGDIVLGPATLSTARVLSIPIALAVLAGLGLFFRHTRDGIAMRAIADDQQAALSMGISIPRVFGVAWGLAAVSAAIGGMMLAGIVGVSPNVASIGLRVFPVVILGGLDSIAGAVLGGAVIGLLEVYVGFYVGHGLNLVVPYVVLVLVLMVRPYGLFGKEIIERV